MACGLLSRSSLILEFPIQYLEWCVQALSGSDRSSSLQALRLKPGRVDDKFRCVRNSSWVRDRCVPSGL